jgi:hypothetical protein
VLFSRNYSVQVMVSKATVLIICTTQVDTVTMLQYPQKLGWRCRELKLLPTLFVRRCQDLRVGSLAFA